MRTIEWNFEKKCIQAVDQTKIPYSYEIMDINNGEIGPISQKLYDTLTGIQWGKLPDELGWTYEVR